MKKWFDQALAAPPHKVLKIAGLALIAIVVLTVGLRLIGSSFGVRSFDDFREHSIVQKDFAHNTAGGFGGGFAEEAAFDGASTASLSLRNIAPSPIPPRGSGSVGPDAEAFEVTQYNASIETSDATRACATIASLKQFNHVIFENANEYDRGCNYTFKVERDRAQEVLSVVQELGPEELSENTYTIQRVLEDFTSEEEILTRKLETIEDTLEDAITAYDSITTLATRNEDSESLAIIIDSKVSVIERLTRERIQVVSQLDQLARAKEQQLDRLVYTYFYVDVYENKFIDTESLGDSWKAAIRGAVRDINRALQDATVNLIALLFILLQYALYLVILLFIVKYGWRIGKYLWKM